MGNQARRWANNEREKEKSKQLLYNAQGALRQFRNGNAEDFLELKKYLEDRNRCWGQEHEITNFSTASNPYNDMDLTKEEYEQFKAAYQRLKNP